MAVTTEYYSPKQSRATFERVWSRWRDTIRANGVTGPDNEGLVSALITVESAGDPKAVGDNGHAFGLMQITLDTANLPEVGPPRRIAGQDLMDPALNITLGTRYLVYLYWLLAAYSRENGQSLGDGELWLLTLASYNAGPIYAAAALDMLKRRGVAPSWEAVAEFWIAHARTKPPTPPRDTFFPRFAPPELRGKPLRKIPSLFVASRAQYVFDMAREISGLIPSAPPVPAGIGAPPPAPPSPVIAPLAPLPAAGAPPANPLLPPATAAKKPPSGAGVWIGLGVAAAFILMAGRK